MIPAMLVGQVGLSQEQDHLIVSVEFFPLGATRLSCWLALFFTHLLVYKTLPFLAYAGVIILR